MTLLARVVGRLTERGISCALIGAEALALRGVSRATAVGDVSSRLADLPEECRHLWEKLLSG